MCDLQYRHGLRVCDARQVVKVWREDLSKINAKAAESLADPAQYPNLFPNFDLALHAEQYQVRPPQRHSRIVLHCSQIGAPWDCATVLQLKFFW